MPLKTFALAVCFFALLAGVFAADLSSTNTESFQIRNKKFGDLLRPEGANGADGTRIVLYPAEPWKCMTWKLRPAGESVYHVQNHFTGKTFAPKVNDEGKSVVQVAFSKDKSLRPGWRFKKLADDTYEIEEAKSGAALTAVESGGTAKIVLMPWQDDAAQKWRLEKTDPATLLQ